MFKTATLIFVLLSFLSCGKSDSKNNKPEQEVETVTDVSPVEAKEFKVNVKLIDFTAEQAAKVDKAAALIKKVIMSKEFKKRILEHRFKGEETFSDNNGLTNEEIYQKILEGAESLKPVKDYEMDMTLLTYYEDAITVGYTYPNTPNVWMNRKFFDRFSPSQVTGNMIHEWMHKIGFDHSIQNTPERQYSVPYAVGYLVQQMASKF